MAHVSTVPSNVKKFFPLTEGKYNVEVAQATLGKSPKGNVTLKLDLNVLDGPDQPIYNDVGEATDETTSCAGRKLATTIWIDETSSAQANAMEAFGVKAGPNGWDSEEFVGKEAVALVKVRLYDDEPVNNVKKFAAAGA